MERIFSKSQKHNKKVAKKVLEKLVNASSNLLFLQGNLGAGKTSLTSAIAETLNSKTRANSPTFVIQKVYPLGKNKYGFEKIIHIDLYRLRSIEQVNELELLEELEDKHTLFIVEWPEPLLKSNQNRVVVQIEEYNKGRNFIIM